MAITREVRQEALSYSLLMARAERCGVPTSLDDPRTPRTVAQMLRAVQVAEYGARYRQRFCKHGNGGEQTADGWICDDCGAFIGAGTVVAS